MVYFFIAEGFEEIEALCPLDLLRRAGVAVKTVGIGGDMIRGAHGITVQADIPEGLYADAAPEMVILPGGMPGTLNLEKNKTVSDFIDYAVKNNKLIAAICAAPSILGHKGLLEGKEATCFPGFENELDGATISDKYVVTDGNIITARGMGSAFVGTEHILLSLLRETDSVAVKLLCIIIFCFAVCDLCSCFIHFYKCTIIFHCSKK